MNTISEKASMGYALLAADAIGLGVKKMRLLVIYLELFHSYTGSLATNSADAERRYQRFLEVRRNETGSRKNSTGYPFV